MAAEPGHVARNLLEPARPDRVGEVAGLAQGQKDAAVEAERVAICDLSGKFDEAPAE